MIVTLGKYSIYTIYTTDMVNDRYSTSRMWPHGWGDILFEWIEGWIIRSIDILRTSI